MPALACRAFQNSTGLAPEHELPLQVASQQGHRGTGPPCMHQEETGADARLLADTAWHVEGSQEKSGAQADAHVQEPAAYTDNATSRLDQPCVRLQEVPSGRQTAEVSSEHCSVCSCKARLSQT